MPGDVSVVDIRTINYIRSDSAFKDAKQKGWWEILTGWFTGRSPYPVPFSNIVRNLNALQLVYRGLKDIAVSDIVGSAGRSREFSRQFYPLTNSARQKERWRNSYARTLTGTSYKPIEVYQVGGAYFVLNGHQRVSVASYLKWDTIQAYVSELV